MPVTKLRFPTFCLLVIHSVAHIGPCSITPSHLSFIQRDCMFWINMFASYDWSWLRLFSVYKCSLSVRNLDTPATAAFSRTSWPRKRRSSPSCSGFIIYNMTDQKEKSYSVLYTHNILQIQNTHYSAARCDQTSLRCPHRCHHTSHYPGHHVPEPKDNIRGREAQTSEGRGSSMRSWKCPGCALLLCLRSQSRWMKRLD